MNNKLKLEMIISYLDKDVPNNIVESLKDIIRFESLDKIRIYDLAKKSNISKTTVYNYFGYLDEIIGYALIKDSGFNFSYRISDNINIIDDKLKIFMRIAENSCKDNSLLYYLIKNSLRNERSFWILFNGLSISVNVIFEYFGLDKKLGSLKSMIREFYVTSILNICKTLLSEYDRLDYIKMMQFYELIMSPVVENIFNNVLDK